MKFNGRTDLNRQAAVENEVKEVSDELEDLIRQRTSSMQRAYDWTRAMRKKTVSAYSRVERYKKSHCGNVR